MKKTILIVFGLLFCSQIEAQNTLSLSLEEAVNYALENSYAAINSTRDIELAEQKNKETVAIGLPQISATLDYQNWIKQQISLLPAEFLGGNPGEFVEIAFGTKHNMFAMATLNQLLFDGSYIVGLQYLETYKQISLNAKEKTEMGIRDAVINAYGNVLLTEESITILNKNISNLEKNLTEYTQIYTNGFGEEESVEQLKITLSQIKTLLSKTKKLKIIGYKMLNLALGVDFETTVSLTNNLESLTKENIKFNFLTTDFNLEQHVDWKIAFVQKEGKEALLKLEKSKSLPTLSSFINFGYAGYGNSFSFHKKEQNWFDSSQLGISLSIPIFSSFSRSARAQQAQINLEKAETNLTQTSQKILLVLETAKAEYTYSIEEFETYKQNLALAERIVKKQEIKFFEGLSTSFELTEAQAMRNVIASKANLDKALNTPINN